MDPQNPSKTKAADGCCESTLIFSFILFVCSVDVSMLRWAIARCEGIVTVSVYCVVWLMAVLPLIRTDEVAA